MTKKKEKQDYKTEIKVIPLTDLVKAEWNFKYPGTPEQIDKLAKSILKDGSSGVCAVRELHSEGKMVYEVLDGNHRLDAFAVIGWNNIRCENFGVISDAQAIAIARRRKEWFDVNEVAYAELLRDIVLPEIPIDELCEFMPETKREIEDTLKNLAFDWSSFSGDSESESDDDAAPDTVDYDNSDSDFRTISLTVPPEVFDQWHSFLSAYKKQNGECKDYRVFSSAIESSLADLAEA